MTGKDWGGIATIAAIVTIIIGGVQLYDLGVEKGIDKIQLELISTRRENSKLMQNLENANQRYNRLNEERGQLQVKLELLQMRHETTVKQLNEAEEGLKQLILTSDRKTKQVEGISDDLLKTKDQLISLTNAFEQNISKLRVLNNSKSNDLPPTRFAYNNNTPDNSSLKVSTKSSDTKKEFKKQQASHIEQNLPAAFQSGIDINNARHCFINADKLKC